jgi:hypothetical protein
MSSAWRRGSFRSRTSPATKQVQAHRRGLTAVPVVPSAANVRLAPTSLGENVPQTVGQLDKWANGLNGCAA